MMQATDSTTGREARRVLLVEDEPAAREASRLYLRLRGYDVVVAKDADEALARADEAAPDVAVCDWRLGGERDGVEVARELQSRFEMPVIFVTAHPLDELRAAASDVSVYEFLHKPVSLAKLASTIESATP